MHHDNSRVLKKYCISVTVPEDILLLLRWTLFVFAVHLSVISLFFLPAAKHAGQWVTILGISQNGGELLQIVVSDML